MPETPPAALNGICPYFTMFPLEFPLQILRGRAAREGDWVLDPFCGRGTTNFAARLRGLPSIGIDSSPVAAALTAAKLANTSAEEILQAANDLLAAHPEPREVPAGEFWEWAFHPEVLAILCRLREGLLDCARSDAHTALRAILCGALHGPVNKIRRSYFSNQCTRTYAPKPGYALRFWKSRAMQPQRVDVTQILRDRAERYYPARQTAGQGVARLADSRNPQAWEDLPGRGRVAWVITSPPYYGMRTYIPDQWLRGWFLGGPARVSYSTEGQLDHHSPGLFVEDLRQVWLRAGAICRPGARMVVRYGGIHDRNVAPLELILQSLRGSGWRTQTHRSAGTAASGKRQSLHFAGSQHHPIEERDVWAVWETHASPTDHSRSSV